MKISSAYISETGGKEKNDDTVHIMWQSDGVCVFVGDGLGGYENGKIASATAAGIIGKYRQSGSFLDEMHMQQAAIAANDAVLNKQKERNGKMKTTMIALSIEGESARWMHVGDSRLYFFSEGKIKRQTMDHSVSQMAVLMGEITQQDVRFHEDRNRILRALGSDNAKPDISQIVELTGNKEAFLLCTDGFWEYVCEDEMEKLLAESETPQAWLVKMESILKKRILKNNDNYSAAAVFCET